MFCSVFDEFIAQTKLAETSDEPIKKHLGAILKEIDLVKV